MSPRVIRRLVIVVFVCGIAGMIVGSVRDNNGFAITFGLITAVAAVGLILVTSVAPSGEFTAPIDHTAGAGHNLDEEVAADVERRIGHLVDAGADETETRRLVQRAVDLGRSAR